MQAVILAAGQGIRLRPRTAQLPKCLLSIDGRSLLERSLEHLWASGFEDIMLVVGFHQERIRQAIGTAYRGMSISYVVNPRYAETGSMYSLSQVEPFIRDELVVLESDLLYERNALSILLDSPYTDVILVADLLHSGDDVYICANSQNQLTSLGKHLSEAEKSEAIGCLVGISRLSSTFLAQLFEHAAQDYAVRKIADHYENCMMAASRSVNYPLYAEFCPDLEWTEIDTEQDLEKARTIVYPRIICRSSAG